MTLSDTLLIYAPVPLHAHGSNLLLEDQACNGLRLWAENFERVIVMMPLEKGPAPASWVPIQNVGPSLERIEIEPLPSAYRPDKFFYHLPSVSRKIRDLINRSNFIGFSIGGLFGDWGSVSCIHAQLLQRPFYVWTDRVESEVIRRTANQGNWRRRLRARLTHRPVAWLEKAIIRRATLGLFHGRETYDVYAPYCRRPELVHDIHLKRADHISDAALAAKIYDAACGPLRICYVGRADTMKGPFDWLEVLEKLKTASVVFDAVWVGDGVHYREMQTRIARAGLGDRVSMPGAIAEREHVLEVLRTSHLFMFCHKTPESPRCLIEALVSGCPIVGYDGSFARDITEANGGSLLTPMHDTNALANTVATLANDRTRLLELIQSARSDGAPFDDESVFRHRSELIKLHLPRFIGIP
jgi:colanic acid/amylovoran biosynthesis glycosyltransferase